MREQLFFYQDKRIRYQLKVSQKENRCYVWSSPSWRNELKLDSSRLY